MEDTDTIANSTSQRKTVIESFIDLNIIMIEEIRRPYAESLMLLWITMFQFMFFILQQEESLDHLHPIESLLIRVFTLSALSTLVIWIVVIVIFALMVFQVGATLYLTYRIRNTGNKLGAADKLLMFPMKIINYYFNWILVVPFMHGMILLFLQGEQQSAYVFMRIGFLSLSVFLMFLVTMNIELFFICPKFESDDCLTMKDTTFKFAFVLLRIAMVIFTQLL